MEPPNPVEHVLTAYRFHLAYAHELVRDVPDELLYRSFGDGLENHPAFALGHLATASALMVEYLGGAYDVPPGFDALFRRTGPGDPRRPTAAPAGAPGRQLLLETLTVKHAEVERIARALPAARLREPARWRFDRHFPTLLDLLTFLCVVHEAMHLAQVAAWRRAAGLESALARL